MTKTEHQELKRLARLLKRVISRDFGPPCSTYAFMCPVCMAWASVTPVISLIDFYLDEDERIA